MRLRLPFVFCLVSLGCGSQSPAGGSEASSAGGAGATVSSAGGGGANTAAADSCPADTTAPILITDDTNYSFTSTLSIQMTTLKDATDLVFDWSGLTRDFYGDALDPAADINTVLISLWDLTPSELQDRLNRDELPRSSNEGAIMVYPDGTYTSAHLLDFGLLGDPLPDVDEIWKRFDTSRPDYQFPQDQHTFLLMAATGTSLGRGGRMLELFNLAPSSNETELSLADDSTQLDYTVDLARAKPVSAPASTPALTIDWSQMTINALGNEYAGTQITEATVAHFATDAIADLERDFLHLETIADGWWSGPVLIGTSIDLSTLTDASGATFPGIDATGTWLVALMCTSACNNPAPWSITIVRPCP